MNVPTYNTSYESKSKNARNSKWPKVLSDHIEEMDDCTYNTIKTALGFTFDIETCESHTNIKTRALNIQDNLTPIVEADIQSVSQHYMLPIIQACVKAGLESLPKELSIPEDTTSEIKGIKRLIQIGDSSKNERKYVRAKSKGKMGWGIYMLVRGEENRYITVGENRLSSQWSSSWLPKQLGEDFLHREA